jgi:hypothetical protein
MTMMALSFLVGALAVSFWSWMRTHRELLKTCRERDEARERLRHAEAELMEAGFRIGRLQRQRIDLFRETERRQQASEQFKRKRLDQN